MLLRTLAAGATLATARASQANASPGPLGLSLLQSTKGSNFVVNLEPPAGGVRLNDIQT
jgi:hypothetical protein